MDLHALLEMVEPMLQNLSPRDLGGFAIAIVFLVVFRGLALVWKRPQNSALASSILQTLETIDPSQMVKRGEGYSYGSLSFTRKGIETVNGTSVGTSHLTRRERRQIGRSISKALVRRTAHENAVMASQVQRPTALAVDTVKPSISNSTLVRAQEIVADCFNGNYTNRSLAGVVKETGLSQEVVATILADKKAYRKLESGLYGQV